jgi:hypothetical protein
VWFVWCETPLNVILNEVKNLGISRPFASLRVTGLDASHHFADMSRTTEHFRGGVFFSAD